MTPQELHAALDRARRGWGYTWWQMAVQVGTDQATLRALRRGQMTAYHAASAWLERHGVADAKA